MINKQYQHMLVEESFILNIYGSPFELMIFERFSSKGNLRAVKRLADMVKEKISATPFIS